MQTESAPKQQKSRADARVTLGLAAGFLLLYLRTLCRTVYLGDSGEIATAIVTGGIIHPPGYPLFSLLGRAALWYLPFGEPAFERRRAGRHVEKLARADQLAQPSRLRGHWRLVSQAN